MSNKDKTLADEQEALGLYLESLLSEVPEAELEPEPITTPTEKPLPAVDIEPPATQVAEPVAPIPMEIPVAPPVVIEESEPEPPAPVVEPQFEVEAEIETETSLSGAVSESEMWEGRPDWGESDFQVLMFRLSGLAMAIPLIELDGILEMSHSLTPLPNRSPWYLGLLDNRGKTVPIVDLAQLVIPRRIREKKGQNSNNLQRIILVGEGNWGLACDGVSEVISLSPDEVKWRASRSKRKWLAGTVIEHMCALLDAEGLAYLLANRQEIEAE